MVDYGFRSIIGLPLWCEGEIIGALTIYASEPDAFHSEEMHLLEELAGDLSYGIEARRREVKRVEATVALRQSEMEFRTLFDNANDAVLINGFDGRIFEVNAVACRRLGYTRDQRLHMGLLDIKSPDARPGSAAAPGLHPGAR